MFTINSTRIDSETLTVNVTFTLKDESEITLDVPIFAPTNIDDVLAGLQNREASEQAKHNVAPIIQEIKDQLDRDAVGIKLSTGSDGKISLPLKVG
jgi:hypothetical protein